MSSERRDETRPHLEAAYNLVYQMMRELEADRDRWRDTARGLGLSYVILALVFLWFISRGV